MEKHLVFLRRPEGEDLEAFRRRYLEEHTRRLLAHPAVGRYVANLLEEVPDELVKANWGDSPRLFDALDEVWCGETVIELYPPDVEVLAAYQVDEVVVRTVERTWAVGERSPWLKRVSLLQRAEGMSRAEFFDYWRTKHAPLALEHHVGAVQYLQNHIKRSLTPNWPEWDGLVQLHYWNIDGWVHGHFSKPNSREVILADIANFIRPGRPQNLMSEYIMRP